MKNTWSTHKKLRLELNQIFDGYFLLEIQKRKCFPAIFMQTTNAQNVFYCMPPLLLLRSFWQPATELSSLLFLQVWTHVFLEYSVCWTNFEKTKKKNHLKIAWSALRIRKKKSSAKSQKKLVALSRNGKCVQPLPSPFLYSFSIFVKKISYSYKSTIFCVFFWVCLFALNRNHHFWLSHVDTYSTSPSLSCWIFDICQSCQHTWKKEDDARRLILMLSLRVCWHGLASGTLVKQQSRLIQDDGNDSKDPERGRKRDEKQKRTLMGNANNPLALKVTNANLDRKNYEKKKFLLKNEKKKCSHLMHMCTSLHFEMVKHHSDHYNKKKTTSTLGPNYSNQKCLRI